MFWEPKSARKCLIYIALVCVFAVGRLLKHLHFCKGFLLYGFNIISRQTMCVESYWDSLFTQQMFQNIWHCLLLDMNKKVHIGGRAYNVPLVSADAKCHTRLLDLARGTRPMVLNFGSCTCPIFMSEMNKYRKMVKDFSAVADFLIVYVEEAHPIDGWAFKDNYSISSHRTQAERCRAAQILSLNDLPCAIMVDTMLNAANIAYGAAPIRLHIVQGSNVVYEGGAGPMGYSMEKVRAWLQSYALKES